METEVSEIISKMARYQVNPSSIQQDLLNHLERVGGIKIIDASNPFVYALESAAVTTAGFMERMEVLTRRLYPQEAQTQEDLYLHMSDADYVDRFAIPSRANITIGFDKNDLLGRLVLDEDTGVSKIVIPRNTYVTVADTVFSIQYPIEIRQLRHGDLQAIYLADELSPLERLKTNIVPLEVKSDGTTTWVLLSLEMQQFEIQSQTLPVTSSVAIKKILTYKDSFYYARVFNEVSRGVWKEIYTTHSDQVYDPLTPTALLKVLDGQLTVEIPYVYVSKGLVSGAIRVDIYQTRGELEMDLGGYVSSEFSATWYAVNPTQDQSVYTAPLQSLSSLLVFSTDTSRGGRNALTFSELRTRVLQNSVGRIEVPITPAQIQNALSRKGYDIVKNVDVVTDRVYLATRPLPPASAGETATPASSTISTLTTTIGALAGRKTVISNGERTTLLPTTLFQNSNGVLGLVSDTRVAELMALPPPARATAVTGGDYFYTPFHYVLDTTRDRFDLRPYQLDRPVAVSKNFNSQNLTTGVLVSTAAYDWSADADGYLLNVYTKSDDDYKALPDGSKFVQLAFVPSGERERAYLQGTLKGKHPTTGEYWFQFRVASKFDVDRNDNIQLSSFQLYSPAPRVVGCPLTQDFDLVWSTDVSMPPTWRPDETDQYVGGFQLPTGTVGITHETIRLKFGDALHSLWAQARSVVGEQAYEHYADDVPRIYYQDVYEADKLGSYVWFDDKGNPYTKLLHKAGSQVVDDKGNPIYSHRKGDIVLDDQGNPVPVAGGRDIVRQMDIFLLEGSYRFATDSTTVMYRQSTVDTLVGWLTRDLQEIQQTLLEKTRVYFYPNSTLSNLRVMFGGGNTMTISAGQRPDVRIYVRNTTYINADLRRQLTRKAIQILSDNLKERTVNVSTITKQMREAFGGEVLDVEVGRIGGSLNISSLTVLDPVNRCSIAKRLVARPDQELVVEDDVTIDFIRHESTDFVN